MLMVKQIVFNEHHKQRLSPIFVSDQSDTARKEKKKSKRKSKGSSQLEIDIKWLRYHDIDVGKYHHLEYMPYDEILNDGFKVQFEKYLNCINNSIDILSIFDSDNKIIICYSSKKLFEKNKCFFGTISVVCF